MSTFKKHVGRIKNTDRRCVVVYMQIPGNDDKALIVDTDALPDRFHDALMDVIDSTEGQQVVHLHTLLSRRILPDMGLDIMNALHTYGLLRPVDIDNIMMYPAPNATIELRTIVDFMNAQEKGEDAEAMLKNRVLENQKADADQGQMDKAQNILRQAYDLENEAAKKREQAYNLVPTLRPQVSLRPGSQELKEAAALTELQEASESATEVDENYLAEHAASGEGMTIETPVDAPSVAISPDIDVMDLPADVRAALLAAVNTPAPEYDFVVNDETGPVEDLSPVPAYEFNPSEVEDMSDTPGYTFNPTEEEGNKAEVTNEALQEFLDRAALREDMADREAWEASQPKNPVGRPRKDGLPAGSKVAPEPVAPAPKKRGRPPKAKS